MVSVVRKSIVYLNRTWWVFDSFNICVDIILMNHVTFLGICGVLDFPLFLPPSRCPVFRKTKWPFGRRDSTALIGEGMRTRPNARRPNTPASWVVCVCSWVVCVLYWCLNSVLLPIPLPFGFVQYAASVAIGRPFSFD